MFTSTSLSEQYADAEADQLRTLVVGSGIAGLTAAQLLRSHGGHPVLVDRASDPTKLLDENHAGYMLALMPMVDPVFDELDLWPEYLRRSVPLAHYGLHDHRGTRVRTDPMANLLATMGTYQGISRGELIETLASSGCPVSFDTTVGALTESSAADNTDRTVATLLVDDQRVDLAFDLVIIADGINSTTRRLVPAGRRVDVLDTDWGGWVVWAPVDDEPDLGTEVWGSGMFLGTYPVRDRLGVFLGGPNTRTAMGPVAFASEVRDALRTVSPRTEAALRAVADAEDPYYWPLTDCRAARWTDRRTVLLGDAGAGFLPTAGIGAAMAMESAWVLTSLLQQGTPETLARTLARYEQIQRPRVEAAQDTSRKLARWMFNSSEVIATLRDIAMRLMSVDVALKPIQQLVRNRPDVH